MKRNRFIILVFLFFVAGVLYLLFLGQKNVLEESVTVDDLNTAQQEKLDVAIQALGVPEHLDGNGVSPDGNLLYETFVGNVSGCLAPPVHCLDTPEYLKPLVYCESGGCVDVLVRISSKEGNVIYEYVGEEIVKEFGGFPDGWIDDKTLHVRHVVGSEGYFGEYEYKYDIMERKRTHISTYTTSDRIDFRSEEKVD